ncbi:MAG: hypothetical protein LRZ84_25015 [Desertifilum sp.]|nr:hypothetical protein [Desertifilum sp.]
MSCLFQIEGRYASQGMQVANLFLRAIAPSCQSRSPIVEKVNFYTASLAKIASGVVFLENDVLS